MSQWEEDKLFTVDESQMDAAGTNFEISIATYCQENTSNKKIEYLNIEQVIKDTFLLLQAGEISIIIII